MTFWSRLARDRELRGVSLEEVAERTKISKGTLERMESGEPKHLPARVYLLGYLRSYAEAVGLDAEDVILRFEEESLGESEVGVDEGSSAESSDKRSLPLFVWILMGLALLGGAALVITFGR